LQHRGQRTVTAGEGLTSDRKLHRSRVAHQPHEGTTGRGWAACAQPGEGSGRDGGRPEAELTHDQGPQGEGASA